MALEEMTSKSAQVNQQAAKRFFQRRRERGLAGAGGGGGGGLRFEVISRISYSFATIRWGKMRALMIGLWGGCSFFWGGV